MNEYQKRLEEFRFHYFTTYGVKLDDEVLYFFIRVNEMQSDIKKQISTIPELKFKSGWDYFMHGLGRLTIPSIILSLGLSGVVIITSRAENFNDGVVIKNGTEFLKVRQADTTYFLQLKATP